MKQYIYQSLVLAVTAVVVALSGMGAVARAANGDESMTISPITRHYQFDAGQTTGDELTVINDGQVPYDVIVYARPYSVTTDDYSPNFVNTPQNADAYTWVQFGQTRFHVDAGQTLKIPYTVRVPAQAAPGGHYGVIFAETQPIGDNAAGSVIRKKRVGMIMYATVKGQYITKGEVAAGSIPFWQFSPPLQAITATKNTGNVDFADTITMTVKNILGKTIYTGQDSYTVLPNTTRKITLAWTNAPWIGLYSMQVTHQFNGQSSQQTGYVLMFPRWLYAMTLVIVAGGIVYAVRQRRR